jgi:hypothetical protein
MNHAKSDRYYPGTSGIRRRITRSGLASILAIICNLAVAANVLAGGSQYYPAYCYDYNLSNLPYVSTAGINSPQYTPYWYAQIKTNGYTTEGIKGIISTAGGPYTFDNINEHLDGYVVEHENSQINRWSQVGWGIGQFEDCSFNTKVRTSVEVYIEIFDDSSSSCTVGTVMAAPANASYDTRYYAQVGSLHRYQIYFEVPGSGNIQDLGWGDFSSLTNQALAVGEALSASSTQQPPWPLCPVLGQTSSNHWNYFGQQASQATFAAELELYNNGSWSDWTSSVPTTTTATAPYQLQFISSYSEFKNGGGQE